LTILDLSKLQSCPKAKTPIFTAFLRNDFFAITSSPGPTEAKIQNPNSKRAVWILDFGVWVLDFGSWILDFFGFFLDFGFWISLVFVLFVAAPNSPVWILEFGFWILDLGFWTLDFGLGLGLLPTVWILQKISPYHADSGRRITRQLSFR